MAEGGLDIVYRFTGKERDEETGLYYYGARYLDAKASRWLSADPALGEYIPGAPVDDEARKRNGNLPGMGGVYNLINLHLYHYAGNNPVKYIDPDGKDTLIATFDGNTITATYVNTTTGVVSTYQWAATNNVRNELNGRRTSPDAVTIPSSGESNWYFPRTFPSGEWSLGMSNRNPSNPLLGDAYIPTNAHQNVPVYGPASSPMPEPDSNNHYTSTGTQNDIGYGLHYSPDPNTWGCIRFGSQGSANEFADLSDRALISTNGSSTLIVE
jgi:RHS repeat-associated protein